MMGFHQKWWVFIFNSSSNVFVYTWPYICGLCPSLPWNSLPILVTATAGPLGVPQRNALPPSRPGPSWAVANSHGPNGICPATMGSTVGTGAGMCGKILSKSKGKQQKTSTYKKNMRTRSIFQLNYVEMEFFTNVPHESSCFSFQTRFWKAHPPQKNL